MKMKKIKYVFLGTVICSLLFSANVFAEESNNEELTVEEAISISGIDEFGTIGQRESIMLNDEQIDLYITYENMDSALEKAKNILGNYFSILKESFELPNIDASNWELYCNANEKYHNEHFADENYDENNYAKTVRFFDIYENVAKNEQIKDEIFSMQCLRTNEISEDAKRDLAIKLPYNTDFFSNHNPADSPENQKMRLDVMRRNGGLQSALSYAKLYAINHNPQYLYYDSDCTNFVSQIAHAGGTALSDFWRPYTKPWTCADDFCKGVGVWGTTTRHKEFSQMITPGDLVAIDFGCDGEYEHCGFVCDRQGSLNSAGYYDYLIAQHGGNYYAWTSSSINHWEDPDNGKGVYYAQLNRIIPYT